MVSKAEIQGDIVRFQQRIARAKAALAEIPKRGRLSKKDREKRRKLEDEVKHVRYLRSIAQEALTDERWT